MENLGFGLAVTVVGMGIVFGLLAVMWALLSLALKLEQRRDGVRPAAAGAPGLVDEGPGISVPQPNAVPSPAGTHRLSGVPEGLDPRVVAAVTVAVLRHAETRRRQAAPAMRSYWPGSLLFASRWVAAGRMRQGQTWRRRAR